MEEGEQRDECGCWECRPQVFTSVLLGILSCVLVTGGVFLAFHKWDHTWLLVSAVGVVLIVIGTILHCCSSSQDEPQQRGSGHKGRPHVIPCGVGDNGTLTEQLLPLSNARSVSQLSLNMVPSYFPAYSIEQHSAVVQNINRIVQGTGRSFLLLPIPADASPTQLQNLMASVCQLDGSVSAEESSSSRDPPATEVSSQTTDTSASQSTETLQRQASLTTSLDLPASSTQTSSPVRIVKHAEVQTCCDWQLQRNSVTSSTSDIVRTAPSGSTTTGNDPQTPMLEENREMPVCLSLPDNATADESAEVAGSTEDVSVGQDVVVDVVSEATVTCSSITEQSPPLECCDIPITADTGCEILPSGVTGELIDISSQTCVPQVVVATEVFEDSPLLDVITVQTTSTEEPTIQPSADSSVSVSPVEASALPYQQILPDHGLLGADLLSITSDQMDSATEIEDSESIGRSSPPPSYDDVTQENNQIIIGAFGLAYGTI